MARALMSERPGLSTLGFVDPQLDPSRRHVLVRASSPEPLPRRSRHLEASIHGAGRTRDLQAWVQETHTTSLLVLDGPLGDGSVVHEWYADDVRADSLLLGASMTKSALAHLVGLAVGRGGTLARDVRGGPRARAGRLRVRRLHRRAPAHHDDGHGMASRTTATRLVRPPGC